MAVRVLHIFSPDYKKRFGGPTFTWKYNFLKWNDPGVEHYVLDTDQQLILEANEGFRFEYPDIQENATRWERAVWIFPLFVSLIKHFGKYDVLHLHVFYWSSLLIGPWAKWKKIPVLYESVLLDEDTPGGVLKTRFGGLQVRLLKSYRAILGISEALAEDYRRHGFPVSQVFALLNSVNDKLFFPARSPEEKQNLREKMDIPPKAVVLVFVGSVIKRKGVDILVQAFIEASSEHPDLHLLIVGPKDGYEQPGLDEGFVSELRARLSQKNLAEKVLFTGLVQDGHRIGEIYRASDIFVFPSRREGLPNVVLEAMASELPVVVSQLPGIEKVIQHEQNGILIPIDDVDSLRNAIVRLSNNLPIAREMGCKAYDHIEKKHSFLAWQNQLIEIYQSLLLNRKGS